MRIVDKARRRQAARWTRAVWRGGRALTRACVGWRPRAIRFVDALLREGDALAERQPAPAPIPYTPPLFTGITGAAGATWAARDLAQDWRHLRSEFRGLATRGDLLARETELAATRQLTLAERMPVLVWLVCRMRSKRHVLTDRE